MHELAWLPQKTREIVTFLLVLSRLLVAVRRSGAVVLRLTGHRTCFHVKRHRGGADCICGSVGWDDLIHGWKECDNAPDQANPCLWLTRVFRYTECREDRIEPFG
jgi:hypothetical protein